MNPLSEFDGKYQLESELELELSSEPEDLLLEEPHESPRLDIDEKDPASAAGAAALPRKRVH